MNYTLILPACDPGEDFSNYEAFDDIQRVMHIDDYQENNRHYFHSCRLTKKDFSIYANYGMAGVWFGIESDPDDHNVYGNIGFTMNLQRLKNQFPNIQMGYMEKIMYKKSSTTRVILTTGSLNNYPGIIPFNPNHYGYPIYKQNDQFYHLKKNPELFHGNSVEIFIDFEEDENNWLFNHCQRIPVNHEESNKKMRNGGYVPYRCFKFNGLRKVDCPYSYTAEEAKRYLGLGQPSTVRYQSSNVASSASAFVRPAPTVAIQRTPIVRQQPTDHLHHNFVQIQRIPQPRPVPPKREKSSCCIL